MEEEKYLIWLSSFEFISAKKVSILYEYYGSSKEIFKAFQNKEKPLYQIMLAKHIAEVSNLANDVYVENFIRNLKDINVLPITFKDERYPKLLKQINDFPFVLYTKGDLSLFDTRCLAVVGTRNPSTYGRTITYDLVKNLAKSGLTIVSGMANGIDSIAHKATLEVGGKTIVVLGSGFNNIYPKINENLANEVANKGLIISEFAPQIRPQKYAFIARNRIIAGLSEGVLITEGAKNSGSLHTKEFAFDYNRNVYAVPGNINSLESEGTNMLIATSQAQCVLSYKDILKDLGIQDSIVTRTFQLSIFEQKILDALRNEPQHFDNLQNITQIESKNLNSYLTTMTIRGIIKKLPGNFYSK